MKFNNLKSITSLFVGAFTLSIFTISCGNDDSGKTSTTETTTGDTTAMNRDVQAPMPTDTTTMHSGKKTGRATAALMTANTSDNTKMTTDKMGYYNRAEVAPTFSGGQSSLENYFNNNIDYPQEAIDNNVEGTVNVVFTIDDKGAVGNAKVTGAKIGSGLEEAAVKAVNQMPKWTPGTIKGKNVKAWYTLPVTFRLES